MNELLEQIIKNRAELLATKTYMAFVSTLKETKMPIYKDTLYLFLMLFNSEVLTRLYEKKSIPGIKSRKNLSIFWNTLKIYS
jgi:hypothetical protein